MTSEPARRISRTLTTDWEKRNLPRIARALPEWVMPDHLTGLGLSAAFVIGAGYVLAHLSPLWLILSVAGLFLHWFGDSLDGTLARVRRQERERYGYYVDRTADAISIVVICASFGLSPFVSIATGLLLAVSYLMIMVYAEICAYVSRTFPMSFAGVGPTEARIALGSFTLALIFWRPFTVRIGAWSGSVLDVVAICASAFMLGSFVVMSAIEARRLDRAEEMAKLSSGQRAVSPRTS